MKKRCKRKDDGEANTCRAVQLFQRPLLLPPCGLGAPRTWGFSHHSNHSHHYHHHCIVIHSWKKQFTQFYVFPPSIDSVSTSTFLQVLDVFWILFWNEQLQGSLLTTATKWSSSPASVCFPTQNMFGNLEAFELIKKVFTKASHA